MASPFTVSEWFPAPVARLYEAWLSSECHAAMTGADARVSDAPRGAFEAWGGYIRGTNIELEQNRRILQAWRTTQFTPEEGDSRLEILFEQEGDGTRVTLHHSDLPEHGDAYLQGWKQHYFEPMQAWLAGGS